MAKTYTDLNIEPRTLLGPGPSMVHPRVMQALAAPTVGHLDPLFQDVMEDVKDLLRYVFKTENALTFPISGTGSAGMEGAVGNAVAPGDKVLVAINGFFGQRIAEMAERMGGEVTRVEIGWGEAFTPNVIKQAFEQGAYDVFAIVHGETSTGVLQPHIKEISKIASDNGALVILDTVASLGGANVEVDAWGIDICYSGSQKCLSAPPGLAPITFNEKAMEKIRGRNTKPQSWYLDALLLEKYWMVPRSYHHTAPVNLINSLRESLRMVYEEGIDNQVKRHYESAHYLWDKLGELGLGLLAEESIRTPTLNATLTPENADELKIRKRLLVDYNIEISGGFGPLAGKIWRIGLMGYSARKENVVLLSGALRELL